MRLLNYKDRGFARIVAELDRQAEPSMEVLETVTGIIAAVRSKGDAALLAYTEKFGGPKMTAAKIRVKPAEIKKARA